MKTVTATDAARRLSSLLRSVAKGEEVLILSRGRPVARIVPAERSYAGRKRARAILLRRLKAQTASGGQIWRREALCARQG